MITRYEPANSESVLGELAAEAQSPRGAAASGGIAGTWVSVSRLRSQGNSGCDAVIAGWRNEARSRAQAAEAKGDNSR